MFTGQNVADEKPVVKNKVATKPSTTNSPVNTNLERPKRIVKRTSKDYSTPSIKDALKGKFKNEEKKLSAKEQFQTYARNSEFENFTKDDLVLKWKEFITRLDDRPNLQSTLSKVPELRDNSQLYLEIDNSIQDDVINSIKPELVSFLRKELKNSKVELITKITDEIKNRIIYTDNDKFDEMVKKNPSLKILKQKFNLDFGEV